MNRITKYPPFLTFVIIPFLGGNHLSLYYVTIDKFWIETSFVLLLIISISVSSFSVKGIQESFLKFSLFVLPYVLINVAGLFYTWNKFNTLNELNMAAWTLGCVYLFLQSEKKDSLLMALVIGASLTAVFMIIQYKILLPNLAEAFKNGRYASVVQEKTVPFSSYLNEATLGGYFLFVIPLAIYFAIFQRKPLFMVLSPIVIFGLLFSLSRMGVLLFSLSLVAGMIVTYAKKRLKGLLALGLILFIASSIFVGVVYAGGHRHNAALQERVFQKMKRIPEHITTLTYRTVTWQKSFDAIREKPLLGYGAGAFEYAYRKYYDATLYTRYAHNIFVKIAVELGLLGIIAFFIYLSGLTAGVRKVIKDTKHFFILLSVASGFLFSLFNVTFEIPAYAGTFFILSSIFFVRNEKIKQGANFIFLPLIAVLLCSFFFTVRADVSQKLYEDGVMYDEQGLRDQAFVSYGEAVDSMPLNKNGYIGLMSILTKSCLAAQNMHSEEEDGIKNMIVKYLPRIENNHDKDSELFFLLGVCYSLLNEEKSAERYFGEAMKYHPSSGFYMYETANFYFQHGNTEKANLLVKRMEKYVDRHTGSDMHGLYVYKMRDLQSNIEYLNGNTKTALALARKNFRDAEDEKGVAENVHAREYVTKEAFTKYFKDKVNFYETNSKNAK